jgi:Protein of unknown function (DUF3300)
MTRIAAIVTVLVVLGGALGPKLALAQTPAPQGQDLLSPEQLDQLVAPIALYPDTLLAEVLMASTYPLEVVQADRWVSSNKNLKGDQLKAAANKQDWDDSVKTLVATPSVLSMMSDKLDWTQKLGDAVLAQQPDVMDAIQRLRTRAQAQDKLQTTKQQTVSVQPGDNGKQTIVITPTQPETVYVPYYNPAVVYGAWPYPAYPPYYFTPPGYIAGAALATGLAFGAGYAVGRWASGGNYWGGGFNWGNNNINVNRSVNINNAKVNNWQHNSYHRRGVAYTNNNVQQHFGNNTIRNGNQGRMDFRGRSGQPVLQPGGAGRPTPGGGPPSRGNLADRGGADRGGDRGNLGNRGGGDRGGDRGNLANRGGGDRGGAGRPQRDSGLSNIQPRNTAELQSRRGRESLGGGAPRVSQGGGGRMAGGGARGGGRRR